MKKFFKPFLLFVLVLSCLGGLACEKAAGLNTFASDAEAKQYVKSEEATSFVRIDLQSGGSIVVKLFTDVAPLAVENFQKLVSESHYDGVIFHRVIKGFMVQGGNGGSADNIKGEFAANGVENNILHKRGVLSMARTGDNTSGFDTASDQFFICTDDSPHLNGQYAAFGEVVCGMDVADWIADQPVQKTGPNLNKPLTDIVMEKVYFVTQEK